MGLYDPGEHPTEFPAEVVSDFTVAEIAAFARSKPADETYCFTDADHCAVAQFGRATGRNSLVGDRAALSCPFGIFYAAGSDPFTFGAFAERLEALL